MFSRGFVALPASTNRTFERSPAKVDGPSISQDAEPPIVVLPARHASAARLHRYYCRWMSRCPSLSRGPSKLGLLPGRTAQNGQPRAQLLRSTRSCPQSACFESACFESASFARMEHKLRFCVVKLSITVNWAILPRFCERPPRRWFLRFPPVLLQRRNLF